MSRKFKIDRDYYDEGIKMYKKGTIELNPGLTVLVGCNGCGKTTLINQLRHAVQNLKLPCISYDNLKEGDSNARSKAGFYGDFEFIATSLCSSEGENIMMNLGQFAKNCGILFRDNPKDDEYWIFMDAVDSGFSIDNILDLKNYFFDTIFDNNPTKDVYIIVSANEYEMANCEQCFDVVSGKYVPIKSYEKYRSVVLKSRVYKDSLREGETIR